MEESNHLIKAKNELIDQLKGEILQIGSQLKTKEQTIDSLSQKLNNYNKLVTSFETNYNSLRTQVAELHTKFEKEKAYGK